MKGSSKRLKKATTGMSLTVMVFQIKMRINYRAMDFIAAKMRAF
jgi:hypothetical protein